MTTLDPTQLDLSRKTFYQNIIVQCRDDCVIDFQPACAGHDTMEKAILCAETNKLAVGELVAELRKAGSTIRLVYGIAAIRTELLEITDVGEITL